MNNNTILQQLLNRYSNLSSLENSIKDATKIIINAYKNGGKVLVCGNGGSCSDADHIVGELMKSFEGHRPLEKQVQKKCKQLIRNEARCLQKSCNRDYLRFHSPFIMR